MSGVTRDAPQSLGDLERWLRHRGRVGPAARLVPLPGGVSSLVAEVRDGSDRWVVKAPLARLSVDDDWQADRRRGAYEAAVLAHLEGALGPARVPRLRFFDEEDTVLGEELLGDPVPSTRAPTYREELLAGRTHPLVATVLGAAIAELHRIPPPPTLSGPGPCEMFDALRLDPYYRTAATRRPELAGFFAALIDETRATAGRNLVHGDFNPKNVLVLTGPPAVLDWEVTHAGDPAFDLGMLMAHLALKAVRGQPDRVRPAVVADLALAWDAYDGPADRARSMRHAGAIMLARLYGKSTVDYLTRADERWRAHEVGCRALSGAIADASHLGAVLLSTTGDAR